MINTDTQMSLVAREIRDTLVMEPIPVRVRRLTRSLLEMASERELVLERAEMHPLGFIHMDVANLENRENLSLHIWSGEIMSLSPFAIHNHFFRSLSFVICGEIHNVEYDVQITDSPVSDLLYEAIYDRVGDVRYLTPTRQRVICEARNKAVYFENQLYSVDKGTFHKVSVPSPCFTATLFLKTEVDLSSTGSYVVGSVIEGDGLSFSTVYADQMDLKEQVLRILRKIR